MIFQPIHIEKMLDWTNVMVLPGLRLVKVQSLQLEQL